MDINTVQSIATAERLIRDLDGHLTDASLRMATNSRHHVAGGEAATVQAVITWAQTQAVARVDTFANDEADGQLKRLSSHLAGLCAALLCDDARSKNGTSVLAALRNEAETRLRQLHSERPGTGSRGPQLEIVCMDHRDLGLPKSLYIVGPGRRGVLKDEGAFLDLARAALVRTSFEGEPLAEDDALVSAVGDCLYELFRNTHDHARMDVEGNHVARSLRGIQARRHAISPDVLAGIVKDAPPLAAYCSRLQPRAGRRDLQLLEFSVFDSGPGLAVRWKGKPVAQLDPQEEIAAVTECFDKHKTTKGIDGRGMGLPIVIGALRERNGFLRIRSGRLALFSDLGLEADAEFGSAPRLQSWSTRSNLPRAAGTLITFVMPLGAAT